MNPLAPFGWLYGKIIDARNAMYDRGWLRSYELGTRTISIGNITTGGTGKTPLVALVAELLAENGERVCVLTRGYGRKTTGRVLVSDGERILVDARSGGDEPVELAQRLLGKAVIVADADRVAAAKWAKEAYGITAFVLDDAFQHRRAKRDVDIVCIDATNPSGGGYILPAGRLREPLKNLSRADSVVITRADLAKDLAGLRSEISDFGRRTFEAETRLTHFVPLASYLAESQEPQDAPELSRPFAFCGVGNPASFFDQLRRQGVALVGTKAFSDHHYYSPADIASLTTEARRHRADCFVTTAKDAVKLTDLTFEIPCCVAVAETVIDDLNGFRELVVRS